MRKDLQLILLVLILTLMSQTAWGRRVSAEDAGVYARNWWLQKDGNQRVVLRQVQTEFENIYLFVDSAGRGFVMLAADDRSLPVLGYSLRNNFVTDSMPDHVRSWIQGYNDQIKFLIENNIEKTTEINEQWKDLNNTHSQLPKAWPSGKGPLLTTQWAQGEPFNDMCPMVSGSRPECGCVATAMAQIMNYYEFPTQGVGQHSYYSTTAGQQLTANFGTTTYDWNNMPDIYNGSWTTAQRTAVSTLIYHIGVAVEMNYATSASSSNTVATTFDEPAAVNAYKRYFKYKWSARSVCMADYSESDWKALLKNEIDNNRPVQYGGSNTTGHSFVCDGYNTEEKFHFNWGWKGSYDGYYAIGALNMKPGGYGDYNTHYNYNNYAAIGIEPDNSTGTSSTVTVTVNNSTLGSVTGGGTYNRSQMVTLVPSANAGCKFVGWSNGSRDVPLKFLAGGEDVTLTANFERVGGDTLYYCNEANVKAYGTSGQFYWGIRIPASSLTAGTYITDIMLFVPNINDVFYVYINEGSFNISKTYDAYANKPTSGKWCNVHLSSRRAVDATRDLYIAIQSYYAPSSMPAATDYASYINTSGTWIHQKNAGNADVAWMIKVVTASGHKISTDKSAVKVTNLSSNQNLSGLARSNMVNYYDIHYSMVSCNPAGIASISNDKITATGLGTVKIKAYATDATYGYAESIVELPIERGIIYSQYSGYWNDPTNWYPNIVPNSDDYDVHICHNRWIDGSAKCHDLYFKSTWTYVLTVESGAALEATGQIFTNTADNLVIKSDATGSGSVIFNYGSPRATVEMYLKGTADADGMNPQWQLRGCEVDNFALETPSEWANIHVYEWDETKNVNGCWTNKMEGSAISLKPWKGYGFANYSTTPTTVTYTGTLVNPNKQWTLSKTGSGNANVGNNMLTNSYSAPIDISEITFTNAQSSVIFYNTGSLEEWRQYGGDLSQSGTSPGQFMVCPKSSAGAAGMPTSIPAGQSFYVVANSDGATVDVNYSDVNKSASGPLYIPEEEDEFNVLGIRVKGDYGADRAVLLECKECGEDYDDGYDGMKFFGGEELPQLYVVNSFGRTSINADRFIVGQRVGLTCKPGRVLRMSFETEKLSGYKQLLLHDLLTDRYVDIVAGEEYEFTTTENDAARFEVVSNRVEKGNEDGMTFSENALFTGNAEGNIVMYDMCGRVVWQADAKQNDLVYLPEILHGVYVIKSDNSTLKIVK